MVKTCFLTMVSGFDFPLNQSIDSWFKSPKNSMVQLITGGLGQSPGGCLRQCAGRLRSGLAGAERGGAMGHGAMAGKMDPDMGDSLW
jgi:hypothetical protein